MESVRADKELKTPQMHKYNIPVLATTYCPVSRFQTVLCLGVTSFHPLKIGEPSPTYYPHFFREATLDLEVNKRAPRNTLINRGARF